MPSMASALRLAGWSYSTSALAAGQLRGSLRSDPRVVNLERTNLAELGEHLINEPVHLITMDLSYLTVADAVKQLDEVVLSSGARMVALVKPTFELHARSLRARPEEVARAVFGRFRRHFRVKGGTSSQGCPHRFFGSNGAVEEFLSCAGDPIDLRWRSGGRQSAATGFPRSLTRSGGSALSMIGECVSILRNSCLFVPTYRPGGVVITL